MKKGGGKQKGSEFERQVCKDLSMWISGGQRKDLFWRSAMSGGRATLALKKSESAVSQAGDVSAIDQLGYDFIKTYLVECKAYKNLNFHHMLSMSNGEFVTFWLKVKDDASLNRKQPMLIAKQNYIPTIVCVNETTYDWVSEKLSCNPMLICPWLEAYIYLFSDILEQDPAIF